MTVQEALVKWDAGEAVWSIEMGGLGPGYEQAIQILVWELVRDAEPIPKDGTLEGWGEKAISRADKTCLGFSGAQVGAAKAVASRFLSDGYEETLAKLPQDRRILVSTDWPRVPPRE